MRISGRTSLAFSNPNLCNLMNSFIVYSTSVSAFEPRRTCILSIVLLTKLFVYLFSNRLISLSCVIFICFFNSLMFDISSSSYYSLSVWSIKAFSFSYYYWSVLISSSAISIYLSISEMLLAIYLVQSSSITMLISWRAFFLTLIDWSLILSIPALRNRIRYFF